MLDQFTLKSLSPLWVLILFTLAACGASTPVATPTPAPTATPLPTPTLAVDTGGEAGSGLRTYVIVPAESRAAYIVDEEYFEEMLAKYGIEVGTADVVGSTQQIEGQLQFDLDDLSAPIGSNKFTVNLATLTTDQSSRDNWIRDDGPQFNRFPLAEFTATGIEGAPDTYTEGEEAQFQLLGDLTIREVTQPVAFDVTVRLEADTATGVATAKLRMTDFGIDPPNFANTLTVANDFEVRVEFTAKER